MTTTEPIKKPRQRILALDILRGITIAGMIMVNNPGSWGGYLRALETCQLAWPDTDRFGVPVLYVYNGYFHLHFVAEI